MSEASALRGQRQSSVLFVRFDFSGGLVRVWSGVNNRRGGPGDPSGIYRTGVLLNYPRLSQLSNAKADRIEILLSGLDTSIKALLDDRKAEVRGALVTISRVAMRGSVPDPDVAYPLRAVRYLCDTPVLRFAGDRTAVGIVATSPFSQRKRPVNGRITDADTQREHPGDKCCDRIAMLNEGVTRVFRGT